MDLISHYFYRSSRQNGLRMDWRKQHPQALGVSALDLLFIELISAWVCKARLFGGAVSRDECEMTMFLCRVAARHRGAEL